MSDRTPLILVIDDDVALLKLMKRDLRMAGYLAITATDGKTGLQLIKNEEPTLVILDIMMPGLDGFQVCERIREFSPVPIIMLTAKGRPEEVIHGLEIGADDYVIKPFSIEIVLARIKAVLRRAQFLEETVQSTFTSGELSIDFSRHRVTLDTREIALTPTEYGILRLLASNAGSMVTHEFLLTQVWGLEYRGDTHILQAAVNRLRKKIGDTGSNRKYIITRSGVGYSLKSP
ncbi:MAG: response regulator transcription factor [Dehalococcoidia bacterium]|nr:response regulator transcription factor [Dehalococcoidia bacterium]